MVTYIHPKVVLNSIKGIVLRLPYLSIFSYYMLRKTKLGVLHYQL